MNLATHRESPTNRSTVDGNSGGGRRRSKRRPGPRVDSVAAFGDSAGMKQSLTYPGGKAGAGVYQRLINEIPPHDIYIAAFAGRDAIARHKRQASQTILVDADPRPLDWWAKAFPHFELHHCDAIEWLRYRFSLTRYPSGSADVAGGAGRNGGQVPTTFVYIDPPYPMSTRTSGPMYRNEMTDADHLRLLEVVKQLPAMVMVCSYPNAMYANALEGWRSFRYTSVARSGERRTEVAWCNYPSPIALHDASFIGRDKREREKVRRRIRRLSSNLARLPVLQRQAVIDAVANLDPDAGSSVANSGRRIDRRWPSSAASDGDASS